MKSLRALLFFFLLAASPVFAAVGVDTASFSGCAGCSGDSWSHTVSGSDRLLLCSAHLVNTVGVSTFTHNTDALTLKTNLLNVLELWFRVAPDTGTNTVAVTIGGSDVMVGGCTSLTGADQSTPLGTAVTDSGHALSTGISLTVPVNGMGYDVGYAGNASAGCAAQTPGAGQTEQFDTCADDGGGNTIEGFASSRTTTGTFTWNDASGAFMAQIGVPILEAVAGSTVRRRIMVIE
jgi:hypothetical protein